MAAYSQDAGAQDAPATWSLAGTVTHRREPVKDGGTVFLMNSHQFSRLFPDCHEAATQKQPEGTSAAYHCAADGNSETSVARVAISPADGSYQFQNVPEGVYYLLAVATMADKKTCLNSGCFATSMITLTSDHAGADLNVM